MKYERLPREDPYTTEYGSYQSAFDYQSIFKYGQPSKLVSADEDTVTAVHIDDEDFVQHQVWYIKVASALFITLSYIFVFITAPVSFWYCFKSLQNWERIIIFRLGRYQGVKGPGFVLLLPFMDRWQRVDMRMKAFSIPPQQLITVDGGIIEMGAEVQFRIANPKYVALRVQDYERSLRTLGKTVLMNILCTKAVSKIEKEKKLIGEEIQESLNDQGHCWGLEVGSVELSVVKVLKVPEPPSIKPLLKAFGIKAEESGGNIMNAFCGTGSDSAEVEGSCPSSANNEMSVLRTLLEDLIHHLHLSTAEGREEIYKLTIIGEESAVYYLKIGHENQLLEGEQAHLEPDVSVVVGLEDFCAIMKGTLPPLQAYINGKLTVQGNVQLLMQFEKCFNRSSNPYEVFTV